MSTLGKLLEGENLQKVIACLVIVAGGGNFLQNRVEDSKLNKELDRAVQEIHDLHDSYNKSVERQRGMEDMLKQLTGK